MQQFSRENLIRFALTITILLMGVLLLPFIHVSADTITWQSLAGVYEPELTVLEDAGEPGSIFAFIGTNYPADSLANVYVDGELLGTVMTDGDGSAQFMIDSTGAQPGPYNVTMEVDINASATSSIDLVSDGDVILPPPDFEGPTFNLAYVLYLPIVKDE